MNTETVIKDAVLVAMSHSENVTVFRIGSEIDWRMGTQVLPRHAKVIAFIAVFINDDEQIVSIKRIANYPDKKYIVYDSDVTDSDTAGVYTADEDAPKSGWVVDVFSDIDAAHDCANKINSSWRNGAIDRAKRALDLEVARAQRALKSIERAESHMTPRSHSLYNEIIRIANKEMLTADDYNREKERLSHLIDNA